MLKRAALATMTAVLLLQMLITSMPTGTGQETRVIKIVNTQTSLGSVTLGSNSTPLPLGGYPFTVDVLLVGTTDNLYTYQVAVQFDKTKVRCTAAWINIDDPSFVFYDNRDVTIAVPAAIDNNEGVVLLGATLTYDYYENVQAGLLCQINFTAIAASNSTTITILPTSGASIDDSFLADRNQITMSFTGQNFEVTTLAGATPPVAGFSFTPVNPLVNQTVTFDASESYDPNGDTLMYMWDFDDGSDRTDNVTTVLHNYTRNGPYLVNLTVVENATDQHFSNSVVMEIQVGMVPHANFTYAPTEINPFELVTFNATASFDPDGLVVSYRWDFADGNVTNSSLPMITHAFSAKGVYRVNLTVWDMDKLHNSFLQDVFIGRRPAVNFTYSPSNPKALDYVTFDASQSHAADTSDYISAYVWNFDDMNVTTVNSTASNPWIIRHRYLARGQYGVNLTVYDNNGLYSSSYQTITIEQLQNSSPDYTLYIVAIIVALIIVAAVIVMEKRKPKDKRPSKDASSKPQSRS